MTKRRHALVVVMVVAGLAVLAAAPVGAQSGTEKPRATEVGVTPSQIRIGVIADVDNPLAPGLFKGAVDGVKAGAAYLNSKAGGGGLAGRKVVVDFYDSKLSANEARNGTIRACQSDYAMVGTLALFLNQVDDIVNCKDRSGQATGIPDIAAVMTGVPEACNPMSFPVFGTQIDCATINENPQTYFGNGGVAKWELEEYGDLHGPFIVSSDTRDANRGSSIVALVAQQAGIKSDQGTTVTLSSRDQQSAFTPVVQKMKEDGSNYALTALAANSALLLRNEAELQGIDASKVLWECISCYGNKIVPDNAEAFEGEIQFLGFLPFEEASTNKTLAAFLKHVKAVGGVPDQFSSYAWSAVLAFGDAVRAVVEDKGINGLTRANLVTGIDSLTDFDTGGMTGKRSFADRTTTACFVMVQFKGGEWVRRYPKKAGTFDCKPSNAVSIKADFGT